MQRKNIYSKSGRLFTGILWLSGICLFGFNGKLYAQDTLHISLNEAIQRGLDSSKSLHLSATKIDEAIANLKQAKTEALPNIKASLTGSEVFIFTRTLQIEGLMKNPVHLPSDATSYLGTLSINEPIFAGNQLRYAQKSADLLRKIAIQKNENDTQSVVLDLVKSYINLYKISENQKIIAKELQDVQGRLNEVIQYRAQDLATDNDVLRFKLQKAQVELNQIDLNNNRAVSNYAMCILLGLPEGTYIRVDSVAYEPRQLQSLQELINKALLYRKEINIYNYKSNLSTLQVKQIKDKRLPTLGVGVTGYYINPNSQFIPPENSYLAPAMVGLKLNWDISSLYKSKHKIQAAKIRQNQIGIAKSATIDQIKKDVNKAYLDYLQRLQKVQVLQTAVSQATENDRIMELKYENQLATTTDRIDAQTLLYQSLVKLSIAKADATTAYYQLLRTTGVLSNKTNL